MAQSTLSFKVSPNTIESFRETLDDAGFSFRDQPNMVFQARGEGAVVSCYKSGSVVIQGANAEVTAAMLELGDAPAKAPKAAKTKSAASAGAALLPPVVMSGSAEGRSQAFAQWHAFLGDAAQGIEPPSAWIGIDEAGKGDFFGPLVIAAVRVRVEDLAWLAQLGVGDSKQINDKTIRPMASELKKVLPHHVIRLMPEKYNELYTRFGNLNRLLAWGHAASSEKVLESAPAELILSDQFTKEPIVTRYFKGPGKDCRYVQRTKAETDAAVACASILARAEFLWGMHELSEKHGMLLHNGAGEPTIADARRFLARFGVDALAGVAKTHFKTMETIGAR